MDELALWLLSELIAHQGGTFNRDAMMMNILKRLGERLPKDTVYSAVDATQPHLGVALSEAWSWLFANGLIAEAATGLLGALPVQNYFFVTRYGRRVAEHPRALDWIAAERRLGMRLHPRLEERARRQFVMGEFEAVTPGAQ